MIRTDSAGRSVVFAAAAALGWLPCALAAGAWTLGRPTLAWYLAAAAAAYLAGLPEAPPARLRAGLVAAALAGALVLLGGGLEVTVLALAVLVAVGRSAVVMGGARRRAGGGTVPLRVGRSVAIELGLGAAGLLAAAVLGARGGGLLGTALAIWGYFAVQSLFFWIGGGTLVPASRRQDPFHAARDRALEILGRG